tara:strand:- start:37 stop:333 length:297 start_codon:yes stop_codon:yes gene_type:complete
MSDWDKTEQEMEKRLAELYGMQIEDNSTLVQWVQSQKRVINFLAEKIAERDAELKDVEDESKRLQDQYNTLLEDVRGACGCTDGDDIRSYLSEYLEGE